MLDHKILLDEIRPTFPAGRLTHDQIELMGALLNEVSRRRLPVAQSAYIMATAQHETAHYTTMEEIGRGNGRPYGEAVLLYKGHRTVRQTYYGRGFIQLTWLWNYAALGHLVGENLVNDPDRATVPYIAAKIAVGGMLKGTFTGAPLLRYVTATRKDFFDARRVINGTDRAEDIAVMAEHWLSAIERSATTTTT